MMHPGSVRANTATVTCVLRFAMTWSLRPTWAPAVQQKDVQGPADLEAMSKWTCKGCGESHYHTFVKCAKCNTYRPHDSDPSFRKQVSPPDSL